MFKCETGKIFKKTYHKGDFYMIRLNIVDTDKVGHDRYLHKVISTKLPATRKNKAIAEALLAVEIEKYNLNSDIFHMSLSAYCDRWLDDKSKSVEVTTLDGYSYRIQHIKEYFGEETVLAKIAPADIRAFYNWMFTTEVQRNGKTVQGYSNRSIKDTATLLSTILDDAVLMELIKRNPAAGIKPPKRPTSREQRAYLSADEVATFRQEIAGHPLELPFTMALYYGMRQEEILGLQWSAIRDGKIYIEHTVARVSTKIEKDRAKTTAGYRSYPITPEIQKRLDEIRANQAYYRKQLGEAYCESDYIFTHEDGRPYSPDYLSKSFKKVVRRSDVLDDRLTLHSLRASCVSMLIHAGMDIKDTQVWVGHTDISTTLQIYARTNERQQKAVASAMDKMIFTQNAQNLPPDLPPAK